MYIRHGIALITFLQSTDYPQKIN